MQHLRDYSFSLGKKKKQPKQPKEEVVDDDPFEQLNNLFKPQSSLDREKNHIYFYQGVDQDSCLELNRKINALNKDLMQHAIEYETEPPNIYLHINSYGGSLFAAFSTIDTIMSSKIPIVSIIEGCAASAATIISMVCHKRYCTPNSFMLIHQLSTGASGKYEEMKDDFMNDTKLMELLYKLYLEHTTMDIKTIKRVLKRDLWWNVNECIKHGLIDGIWNGSRLSLTVNKDFSSEHFNTEKVVETRTLKRKHIEFTSDDLKVSDESDTSDDEDETEQVVSKSKQSKQSKSTQSKQSKSTQSTQSKSTRSKQSKQIESDDESDDVEIIVHPSRKRQKNK